MSNQEFWVKVLGIAGIDDWPSLEVISLGFGILGIMISTLIAYRQNTHIDGLEGLAKGQTEQLSKLKEIGSETQSTARKLEAEAYKEDFLSKFFFSGDPSPKRYTCVFPAYYDRRPLPFIVAGDYYALHVLQNLIADRFLDIKPIPVSPADGTQEGDIEIVPGDVIYLCAPQANPELSKIAPGVNRANGLEFEVPKFGNITLPCWFANEINMTNDKPDGSAQKSIWVPELQLLLDSHAEDAYNGARNLRPGQPYSHIGDVQSDLAILLRITDGTRKCFVIAGIHQYGTWICGEFVRQLSQERPIAIQRTVLGRE